LHSEELHKLYSSPNIIRKIKARRVRWEGYVACMGEDRKVCRVLVGKSEGKRPRGIPRCRWEDKIRRDLWKIGWRGVEWIQLAHDRGQQRTVVNEVMNLQVLASES
jgi:hypothetical protein